MLLANEQEQNRAHEQAGHKNADGNERTELGKGHRATQHQSEKAYSCCERTKEHRAAEFCYRHNNGLLMWFAISARLQVASDDENREIHTEADKDRAKRHTDHA